MSPYNRIYVEAGQRLSLEGGGVTLWTPAELSLSLWMDASDTTTIHDDTVAGRVDQWDDKSGNGNNGTQGTPANKLHTGIATINGLNALSSDGQGYPASLDPRGVVLDNSIDLFDKETHVVFEIGDFTNDYTIFGGSGNHQSSTVLNTGKMRNWASAGGLAWTSNTSPTWTLGSGTTYMGGWIHDTTGREFMLSGSSQSPGGVQSTGLLTASIIGYQQYAGSNGLFAEIVVTDSLVSTADRERIDGYFAWKWGLVASLPVGHPYKNEPPKT